MLHGQEPNNKATNILMKACHHHRMHPTTICLLLQCPTTACLGRNDPTSTLIILFPPRIPTQALPHHTDLIVHPCIFPIL